MTHAEIEKRIRIVQHLQAEETHPSTLRMLAGCMEKLVLMEADDEDNANTGGIDCYV
jgi:hypothetical protein